MNWIFFPKTDSVPNDLLDVVNVFEKVSSKIDSTKNDVNEKRLWSDDVLRIIEPGLLKKGFQVEKSKKKVDKVRIPVLFGGQGVEELAFEADAYNKDTKVVIEVEGGRAVTNYQFLKDIFQASMMVKTDYLVLGVRRLYKGRNDFEVVSKFLDTIYLTQKIKLDLKGILLIGY
tara:strand:+ start:124 stop:642 length:519 start_codon:yes stop_codon:yes gene_type:complete